MSGMDRYYKRQKEKQSTSVTSSSGGMDRYYQRQYYKSLDTSSVDDTFINTFLSDANSFFSGMGDSSISYTDATSRLGDLSTRYNTLQAWLYKNKSGFDKESYSNFTSAFDTIGSNLTSAKNYYSKWSSEDEYQEYNAKATLDLDSAWAEIEDLTSKRDEYNSLQEELQQILDAELSRLGDSYSIDNISKLNPRVAEIKEALEGYGDFSVDEIENTISSKTQYYNQAKEIQDVLGYSAVPDAEDYEQYSQAGANAENPTWDDASAPVVIGGWKPFGDGDEIVNMVTFAEENSDKALVDSALALNGGGGSEYTELVNLINNFMYPEEKGIYNYYIGKGETEKADEYLTYMTDILRQRQAGKMVEQADETALELAFSLVAGLDQWASGVKNLDNYWNGTEADPTSSVQYAQSAMSSNNTGIWKVSNDLINTTGNMLPSILVGSVTRSGLAGSLTLGASAVGNAYAEMRNLGYSAEQARNYATLVGASEAGISYVLGGISALGGKVSGNIVSKAISKIDNAFARVAIQLGGSMLSEGFEEGLQTALEPWFKSIATGVDFEAAGIDEILYSGLLGALSAGLLEGGGTVAGEVNTYGQGKNLMAHGVTAKSLSEYVANNENLFSADTVAHRLAGKVDENTGAYTIARLFNEINATLTEANQNDIIRSLERKGVATKDAKTIATTLASVVAGAELTDTQKAALDSNPVIAKTMVDVIVNPNSTVNQRMKGFNEAMVGERVAKEFTEKVSTSKTLAESTAEAETKAEEIEPAESGKTLYNGEEVSIKKIVSTDGGIKVELDNGETVNATDLSHSSKEEALMYEMVARMETTPETANEIINAFKPSDLKQATMYFASVPLAYNYGKINYEAGLKNTLLTDAERKIVYNRGRNDAMIKANSKSTASKKVGSSKSKDGIIYEDGFTYDESTASEIQKVSMAYIEAINKMSNLEVHVFESKVVDGKRVAKVNGKTVPAPNGYFQNGNQIYIDINAGNNAEGVMLHTMAHEISHYIRKWNEKGFKELGDFLMEQYGKKGVPVHALLEAQKEKIERRYKEEGKTLPSEAKLFDMAYEELVADAMSEMLADPKAYEKLAKLKQKNRTLWQKVGEAIKAILDKFKTALGIYKDKPVTREAYFVRDFAPDVYEKLQDLYIKAFVEADNNYSSAEQTLVESGIAVNPDTDSASLLSVRDVLSEDQRKKVATALATRFGVTKEEAMDWLKAETSMASLILNPKYSQYLDYTPDPNEVAIKQNSDYPQGTVDFSPICAKRREFTSVMNNILRLFPNHVFAATDLAKIRTIMQEEGMTIPCGICYVEDRRQLDTIVAQNFIDSLKLYREGSKTRPDGKPFNANQLKGLSLIDGDSYTPSVYELVSLEGLTELKKQNPNMAEAWIKFNNARGMQSVRLLANEAEYKRQILKYTKKTVQAKNDKGGLRVYSFSDAEMFHLIDIIQVITDSATVGLSLQGYTKVNEYAKAVKDTGEKLNRSLIPKGELGYHIEDGKVVLDYDTVEGIDINHPDFFDNKDNPNVGNITIGVSDVQIRAAMVSDFVDQIIPFHTGQSEEVLGEKGIATWTNYKDFQTEKDIATGKVSDHQINIYTEVLQVLEKEGKPINKRTFVEKFLQVCKENNLTPRFSQFLNTNEKGEYVYTEGYHKMLVDFKTFAQTEVGEYLPQMPVKPIFDNDYITKILKDYVKSQKVKDAGLAESMPKVIERITNEIVKPSEVKYSDRVLMGSLFSGGGTLEAGLVYQMLDKEFAVEYNKKIASVYTDNHGKEHMFVGDVRDFNSKEKQNVFYLHASPVCKNFSPASHSGGETTLDITTAEATARVLEEQMPQVFTVENVKRYIGSEAYNIITNKLNELGYTWDVGVYKASDYGNATKRERMIIRAVKDGQLPAKPQKASNITSWGEATRDLWKTDLIPSHLVKSKIEAIKNTPSLKGVKLTKLDKPLLIYDTTKSKTINYAWADELAPTLTTKCGDARIIMPDGRVYAPTPKFMGRIQGLPDNYKYPKAVTNAFKIIGNGIPTQLTKAVMGGVLDSAYEQTHDGQVLYSDRDSNGNTLSKEQQEFFKDSKVRDKNGNLMVMYHGTNTPNFTVFDPSFSDDKISLFFTNSPLVADSYTYTQDHGRILDPYRLPNTIKTVEEYNQYMEDNGLEYRIVKVTDELIAKVSEEIEAKIRENKRYDWYRSTIDELKNVKGKYITHNGEFNYIAREDAAYKTGAEAVQKVVNDPYWVTHRFGNKYSAYLNIKNPYILNAGKTYTGVGQFEFERNDEGYETASFTIGDEDFEISKGYKESYEEFIKRILAPEDAQKFLRKIEAEREKAIKEHMEFSGDTREKAIAFMQRYGDTLLPFSYKISNASIDYSEAGHWKHLEYEGYTGTTRDLAKWAYVKGYDGVIIENVKDTGGFSGGLVTNPSTIAIAFSSEQVKATNNKTPTSDPDIRYSLRDVEPVEPTSGKWQRTLTTPEVKALFPDLWDVSADESEVRNPTQISGTVKSYRKVYDFLKRSGFNGTILDASSGLGYGTRAGIEEYGFDVEDIEPYPDKSNSPKYTDYSTLDKQYDVIISNAVLNVIPQDQRDALVVKMGELLKDGGRMFINVRGDDVKNASSKVAINEDLMEYYISKSGSYQKGFTKSELAAYLQDALGDGFTITPITFFGKVSAVVTKNEVKFSDRDTDSVSNRTLLANALESVAQNDIEKAKLAQYKDKITLIESEQAKLAEIRAKANAIRFTKGRTSAETKQMRDLDFEANQISNRISTYDKQLLNLESTKALKNVLEREKANLRKRLEKKGKEALNKQKEKDAKTIRELMNRHTESRQKAIEGRHKTEMRHKIKKVVSDLNKLLLNPTKEQHVPIGLQGVVAEALDAINMDTMNAEERVAYYNDLISKSTDPDEIKMLTRKRDFFEYRDMTFKDKITALKNAYAEFKESDDPLIRNAHNDAIEDLIKNTADAVGNKSLKDMSYAQLEAVYDMYKAILATVRNSNKMFKENIQATVTENSESVKVQVKEAGGHKDRVLKVLRFIKKFGWNMLKPITAMKVIGSNTFAKLFDNVRAGEDVWATDVNEAKQFYDEVSAKYGYKKWDFKKMYTFKDSTGTDFSISLEQMMSLYAYSKRDQADQHLEFGGFIFDDAIEVTEKKLGIPLKYEVNDANPHRIRKEDLIPIVEALTTEQKCFIDEMQTYLSDVMGAKGNEVSLALYDIKLYKEKNYFPLKTARYFREFDPEKSGTPKVKNAGFSKKTVPKAGNPIVLSNFMDVWASHVNDMSMYHAFVLPLEDFMRVYNYSSTAGGYDSVQQYIKNAYGAEANQYIERLMDDLNGGARVDSSAGIINKGLSLFKKASVFASASVVVQQPSAIARAFAYINPKYFVTSAGSALNLAKHKAVWAEVKKYAPVAVIKDMGYFDTGMGRSTVEWIKGNKTIKDKVDDALSKAPAIADELSWSHIWLAVKNEIKATTNLNVGSEEFLKRCGERFTEIITNTQVYDSVLSRSGMMRSKDTGMKMATAFMAEPTTTVNMMVDGIIQGKRGNKKFTASTVGAVSASIILNSMLVALVYAARDDDEDETYAEKYIGSLTTELLDGFNPLTYIPFVKDIWSIAQGYDVERSDMSIVSDLWKTVEGLFNEDKSGWEKVADASGAVSSIFGFPLKNILRDAKGMYNLYETVTSGTPTTEAGISDAIGDAFKSSIPLWDRLVESESKSDKLYEAILSGDKNQIDRIKGQYKSEDAIESAMKQGLRENDPRIKEAAQARYNGDISEYTRIAKEIIAEGNFSQDTVVGAINAEISAIKRGEPTTEEPTEDKDEATSIYSTSDMNVAFDNGDTATALEIINDLIETKVANGKTEKEARTSLRSSMTSYWKPLYKEAYQSGDTSEMARIRQILYSSGLYGTANDVVKTAQSWLKD